MRAEDWLVHNFRNGLRLSDPAIEWLMDLWAAIQFFADIADKDDVDRDRLDRVIASTLVSMPTNAFFVANADMLRPALATALLKWKAADEAELRGEADEKSFVWRASYYDIVLLVVALTHGFEEAMARAVDVMSLYGEKFADYRREFPSA